MDVEMGERLQKRSRVDVTLGHTFILLAISAVEYITVVLRKNDHLKLG